MAKITTATGSDADLTLEPDGTGDINLTPGTNGDVNIPANKGITFGAAGEKIEGNATKLDIAAAEIDFSIEGSGDINIPANIGLTFASDDNEKIESDDTDLTVSSGGDINLTAASDVNIPAQVGLTFGADTEKIEVDGSNNVTHTAAGNFTVDATGDIILDADGADIKLKDGGVQFGTLKQASTHLVIQPESSKEIIFNDGSGTASLTVDAANQNVSINNGNIAFGTAGKGIDFSGAQTAVGGTTDEILSGYEEGTFTPSMGTSGTHGSDTIAIDNVSATYVKIGRIVTYHFSGQRNDATSHTGGDLLYIRNFPFASDAVGVMSGGCWFDPGSGDGYKGSIFKLASTTTGLFLLGSSPSDPSRYLTPIDTYWAENYYFRGSITHITLS